MLGLETKVTGEETFVEPGTKAQMTRQWKMPHSWNPVRYSDRRKILRGRVDADEVILSVIIEISNDNSRVGPP